MEPPAKRPKRSRSRRMRVSSPSDTPRTENLEMVSEPPRKTAQSCLSGLDAPSQGHQSQCPAPVPGAQLKRFQNTTVPNFSTLTRNPRPQGYIPTQSPPPAVTGNQQGFQHLENPFNSHNSLASNPPPSNLGRLLWPKIGFGDRAPRPRWLVTSETQPRGRWNLLWTFDPGSSAGWNQLNKDQLYEYAYKCLEDALDDPISREQFRIALTTGPVVASVSNVEDPLPPLPPAPQTSRLDPQPGLHRIVDAPTKLEQATYYFPNYERPSMAVRPGLYARPSNLHVMAAKMFHHMKGTLGPPRATAEEGDGSSSLEGGKSSESQSSSGMQSSRVTREQYDPERTQDILTSGRLAPLPPEDGGAVSRIGSEVVAQRDLHDNENHDNPPRLPSAEDPPSNNDAFNPPATARTDEDHFGLFDADEVEKYYPDIGQKVGGATQEEIAETFMSRWAASIRHYPPDPEAEEYFENIRLNHQRGGKDEFLLECLEISHDPVKREAYFPSFGPVRRIRSWAGSDVPAGVAAKLRARASTGPSSYRPFQPFHAPNTTSPAARSSGPPKRRGRRRTGTIRSRR